MTDTELAGAVERVRAWHAADGFDDDLAEPDGDGNVLRYDIGDLLRAYDEAIRLACLAYVEIDDHGHPLCAVAIAERLVPLMKPDTDTPNDERLREIIRGHLESIGEAHMDESCDCDEAN